MVDTVRATTEAVYVVRDLLTQKTFEVHSARMRQFDDAALGSEAALKDVAATDGSEEYDVKRVVSHRLKDDTVEVRVQWLGFEELTWEPLTKELMACEKVANYSNHHGLQAADE